MKVRSWNLFSHKSRRSSRRRSLREHERDRHPPTACPTQRAPTIFRPTNFLKIEMDQFDRRFARGSCRSRDNALPKETQMCSPAAETSEEQVWLKCALSSAHLGDFRWGQRTLQMPS